MWTSDAHFDCTYSATTFMVNTSRARSFRQFLFFSFGLRAAVPQPVTACFPNLVASLADFAHSADMLMDLLTHWL